MDKLARLLQCFNVFHSVNHLASSLVFNNISLYRLQPSQCASKSVDLVDVEVAILNVCKEFAVFAKGIDSQRTSCEWELENIFSFLVIYISIYCSFILPYPTDSFKKQSFRSFKHEMTNSRFTYLFHMSSHSSSFATFHPVFL